MMLCASLLRRAPSGLFVIALLPGIAPCQDLVPPRSSTDGVAFIRVHGDVLVDDDTTDWDGPEVLEDVILGTGSGFVVAPSGLVLTNHHVISGGRFTRRLNGVDLDVVLDVQRIEVSVWRGGRYETYDGSIVASDPELDLAALQIVGVEIPYVAIGDSDAAVLGQPVKVIGFPFGSAVELGRSSSADAVPAPTVTAGSLSAIRPDEEGRVRYLQTDASVHPGSSGGPILDEDGYALGVVSLKLSLRDSPDEGAAFGVPINWAKGFLDAAGMSYQLPGQALAMVAHDLTWKGVRVDLVDGMEDHSSERVRIATERSAGVSFMAVRFWSQSDPDELEGSLFKDRVTPGFAPANDARPRRRHRGEWRTVGSAVGRNRGGEAFWIEYMILEVGPNERLAARFLGPPEVMAFNQGTLRRALETLEARVLLTDVVYAPPAVTLQAITLGNPPVDASLPAGWSQEPALRAGCASVPPSLAGIAASPEGDFTIVLRVLRWSASEIDPRAVARACGQPPGSPPLTYARNGRRLGSDTGVWGTFQRRGDSVILLEAEALPRRLPFLSDLYVEWTRATSR